MAKRGFPRAWAVWRKYKHPRSMPEDATDMAAQEELAEQTVEATVGMERLL